MVVEEDRQALSPVERVGMGIYCARRHQDPLLVGLVDLNRASQLRRQFELWRREQGPIPPEDRARRRVRSKSLGPVSGARKCLRVGGGLLERDLSICPVGRL